MAALSAPNEHLLLNLARLERLEALRCALQGAGIEVLYLKGAAFLDTLYPDLGERPMVDVDLLLRPEQRARAGELLLAAGFARWRVEERPVTEDEHFEWVFVRPGPVPLTVELHGWLCQAERFDIDYDGLWRRARRLRAARREIPTLSAEDSLLYVSIHEGMHSFVIDERSAEDLRRIIEVWGVDWPTVLARAAAWKMRTNLYVSLAAARHLRGAAVPDEVLARLRPSLPRRGWMRLLVDLEGSGRCRFSRLTRTRQLLVVLLTVEHPRNLARFFASYGWLRARDLWAARGTRGL